MKQTGISLSPIFIPSSTYTFMIKLNKVSYIFSMKYKPLIKKTARPFNRYEGIAKTRWA